MSKYHMLIPYSKPKKLKFITPSEDISEQNFKFL